MTLKNKIKKLNHRWPLLFSFSNNIVWGSLLGMLIFLPFLGVLILGLQNFGMMETVRVAEQVEKAGVKANLFHQQVDKRLLLLEQTLKNKVQMADQQDSFNGLSKITQYDDLVALAVKVDETGHTPSELDSMQTYAGKTLQANSNSEILSIFRQLAKRDSNTQEEIKGYGIWLPKNSIVGEAYLYCWLQNESTGFCTLITAANLYAELWGTGELSERRQQFLVSDHFNQASAEQSLPPSSHNFVINMRGLILSVSPIQISVNENNVSGIWLLLAMVTPLLGLAIAIAWMIYIYHQRQTKNAEKLLHGTQEIAHELRTPLSNISLYTGLIMRSEPSKERDQYGVVLDNEMQRITRIIDNAVSLMRGEPVSGYEEDSPLEQLNKIATQYERYLQEAGCSLSISGSINSTYYYPKQATEQILVNLISNAKKYAPNSHVTLGTDYKNNILSFWVKDEANDNTDKKVATKPPGLGLGLMTCERLARNFSGEFKVKLNENGRSYTVSFPLQEEKE